MRDAEAVSWEAGVGAGANLEELLAQLWYLHSILPLESYFQILEQFIDRARETLEAIPDPEERERLREHYREVIEYAIDVACVPQER